MFTPEGRPSVAMQEQINLLGRMAKTWGLESKDATIMHHKTREHNKRADKLANHALDIGPRCVVTEGALQKTRNMLKGSYSENTYIQVSYDGAYRKSSGRASWGVDLRAIQPEEEIPVYEWCDEVQLRDNYRAELCAASRAIELLQTLFVDLYVG